MSRSWTGCAGAGRTRGCAPTPASRSFTRTCTPRRWSTPGRRTGTHRRGPPGTRRPRRPASSGPAPGDVWIPGGTLLLGAPREESFAFDNEQWAHPVEVRPFAIARAPVTQAEFAAFVDAGGYHRQALWSDHGWRWRAAAGAVQPRYWRPAGGVWERRDFDRWVPLEPHRPVAHVNWYEAEAYCSWAARRLPTEAEWETAAVGEPAEDGRRLARRRRRYPWGDAPPGPARANADWRTPGCVDVGALPAGDSAFGCRQMLGNVWEWTSSTFLPYPGSPRTRCTRSIPSRGSTPARCYAAAPGPPPSGCSAPPSATSTRLTGGTSGPDSAPAPGRGFPRRHRCRRTRRAARRHPARYHRACLRRRTPPARETGHEDPGTDSAPGPRRRDAELLQDHRGGLRHPDRGARREGRRRSAGRLAPGAPPRRVPRPAADERRRHRLGRHLRRRGPTATRPSRPGARCCATWAQPASPPWATTSSRRATSAPRRRRPAGAGRSTAPSTTTP